MSPRSWPVDVAAVMAGAQSRQRWPHFPVAAEPEQGRLGHGAGPDPALALLRATGEMIEIASCCAWGDEPLVTATIAEVGADGWAPDVLSGFSDDQRADRVAWNQRLAGLDWIPADADRSCRIAWIEAACLLSGKPVLVPADSVLIGRRIGDADAVAIADTNGCAAGETPAGALRSALFELVERDATGRWWYGRQKAFRLAADRAGVPGPVIANLHERGRELRLLDITSDLDVPTVAAIGIDRDGAHVAAGFAARADMAGAAQAAVTELMQMELKIAFARSVDDPDPGLAAWLREIDFGRDIPVHDPEVKRPAPTAEAGVDHCLSRLAARGCRIARLDLTRAAFGVPVIRAISPDLCHWKPRFGRARLGSGPAGMPEDAPLLRI